MKQRTAFFSPLAFLNNTDTSLKRKALLCSPLVYTPSMMLSPTRKHPTRSIVLSSPAQVIIAVAVSIVATVDPSIAIIGVPPAY